MIAVLISTLLVMAKLRGGFNYRWEYVFSPVILTMLFASFWNLVMLYLERSSKLEFTKGASLEAFIHSEKMKLYDEAIGAYEFFLGVLLFLDLSEFLNRATMSKDRHPTADKFCYTLLIGALISLVLRMNRSAHQKSIEMIEEEGEEAYIEWKKNTKFPVVGIFLNQIFNLLGASTMVCAGGACNSIYISSITLFFSSIGISLTDWLPFLNGLGFIFIIVALVSVYSAKKDIMYPPFLLACAFSFVIFLSIIGVFHNVIILVIANVGMIGCSCYNLKENAAPAFKRKKKGAKKPKSQPATEIKDEMSSITAEI
jgi:hypothetical protein